MKVKHMICNVTHAYFIVITIFLFGANTSMAAPRPYLPTNKPTNLPLITAVSQLQAQQKGSNPVIWVNGKDGPEYFSQAGLTSNSKNQAAVLKNFGGLQDIDMSSDQLAAFTMPDSAVQKISEKSKSILTKSKHLEDNNENTMVTTTTPDSTPIAQHTNTNAALVDNSNKQLASSVTSSIWLDIDSATAAIIDLDS